MLWPKNSFGVVTCPWANAVLAAKTSGTRAAARQVRWTRVIQNLRKVGYDRVGGVGGMGGGATGSLSPGPTRQKAGPLTAAAAAVASATAPRPPRAPPGA